MRLSVPVDNYCIWSSPGISIIPIYFDHWVYTAILLATMAKAINA